MKRALNYGRISWSYEDFDPRTPCRPSPFMAFAPIRIKGKIKSPDFGQRVSLMLLKHRAEKKLLFPIAYQKWEKEQTEIDLGEGRAFYRWLLRSELSIQWHPRDFRFHCYFQQKNSPRHGKNDELAPGHSFAIAPVKVKGRVVKLYLPDEAILNLLSLPYGEDMDFLELVRGYVGMRFKWEKWKAPSPPFLDWVKAQGKRPTFSSGQLGIDL